MEIGLFQLENLMLTPMPFAFLDLRDERAPVHPEVDKLIARAESTTPDRAVARLREMGVTATVPIVILCEDGTRSPALFKVLEREGFEQIYVVEGGTRGLRAELAAEGY